jgi:PAS domain S-box-containing protein
MRLRPLSRLVRRFALVLGTGLLLLASGTLGSAAAPATEAPKVLRVVMDDNYPPYVFKDDQGQLKGIIVDQWQLWSRKTGIRAQLTGMDWADAQRRMQAGEFDVIDTMFFNAQRAAIYAFTKPYARIDVPLYFHTDIAGIRGPADVKGFLVGAKAGGNVISFLRNQGVTSIAEYPSYERIVEAAAAGKLKVFTVDKPPAHYFLYKLGVSDRFRETAPMYSGEFHRAVLKEKAALLPLVEQGFAAISPAEYQAIETRWLGKPLNGQMNFRVVLYVLAAIVIIVGALLVWLLTLKRAIASKTRELAASELRYRTLVESSVDVIFVLDASGVFQFISPAWEMHFGYPVSEAIGKPFIPFVHPEDVQPCATYLQQVMESGQVATSPPFRVRHADGNWCHFIANGTPYRDAGGALLYLGVARDISAQMQAEEERLHLEKQLLHAQKLESLGVLAGGIAHDFNNILTAIIGNAELALMRSNPESPARENLQRIEKAAARAADLARQMLAYSGKGKFVVEAIDLNRMVAEMGHILEVSISKKVTLRFHLSQPLPAVEADSAQMHQVIMNLVINASEAIGDQSGVISITTGALRCSAADLRDAWQTDHLPEGEYVYLQVDDSGCGMDHETKNRIFDPFFTTKFAGRGLGMAAVLGIIRGHKGVIKVYSEPGKGSSFRILLPASGRAALPQSDDRTADTWQGSGTALLVDDEEAVRDIGGEMLRELGFQVVTATDGLDAVEKCRLFPDIRLVILDLTMPHMDGEHCFHQLQQLDPTIKVIMSSGFSEHEVAQKFAGTKVAGFVQKPYALAALRGVLRNILAA